MRHYLNRCYGYKSYVSLPAVYAAAGANGKMALSTIYVNNIQFQWNRLFDRLFNFERWNESLRPLCLHSHPLLSASPHIHTFSAADLSSDCVNDHIMVDSLIPFVAMPFTIVNPCSKSYRMETAKINLLWENIVHLCLWLI